jgi:resuscitation-promoting factor RpfB
LQRAGLIVAALILPCCGGMTALGVFAGDDAKTGSSSGTGNNIADVQPIDATTTSEPPPPTTASQPPPTETQPPPTEQAPTETITKKTVTERAVIPYRTSRVKDSGLAKGKTRVRTAGVTGLKTITYEVTYTDGEQTARRAVKTVVTRKPVTKVIAVGTKTASAGNCDPNYRPCVPIASDVDCAGGSGNGPAYVDGPVTVIGSDIYDLDRDNDGVACDT